MTKNSISNLREKMKELDINKSEPYTNKHIKNKLRERYEDNICISECDGYNDLVTMREKTSTILRSYFQRKDGNDDFQKWAIIETAAMLIKSEIKTCTSCVTDTNPSTTELLGDAPYKFLPESLWLFLDLIIVGDKNHTKVSSIGQALIQATRPRMVLVPLQVGLGVQLYHLFRSEFLLSTLATMGFCVSYKEVKRFKKNAASFVSQNFLDDILDKNERLIMFAGDNVDHNLVTLDGHGTFHGMGIIAATTPGVKLNSEVKRCKVTDLDILNKSRIPIVNYRPSSQAHKEILFEDVPKFPGIIVKNIDVLWELSLNLTKPTPNWQKLMHTLHSGSNYPGKSTVTFLPMIDMYSGDRSCILSTFTFTSTFVP
ncbi:uncharacterized protein LOC117121111 [Anneissia japonica]|uniref:uncharacterized protein LOC117121111 n=1 Tax=Anneissia japonica TaxID=1529436 RepID=UPI001425A0F3|nr:uncharacterized protein LOC117121111 [Anneissia japonica]XP_033122105.1 uncharacterized protein LOC117121111 [Anneissia japonica]